MTTQTAPATEFERVTCSRCKGTGRYSRCQTMRGPFGQETCFRCGGQKEMLTPRGQKAYALYVEALSVRHDQLEVGMMVRYRGRDAWAKVTEILPDGGTGKWRGRDGVWNTYFEVKTTRCHYSVMPGDTKRNWRVAHTKAHKVAKLLLALRYQSLLTKAGKPRVKAQAEAAEIEVELLG